MRQRILAGIILGLAAATTNAALIGRVPLTPGGSDYQAYYDDVLNITWLADANYAKTSGYDSDGLLTWAGALAWVASLNSNQLLGVTDWRLPSIFDTDVPGCDFAYSNTDCGWNVDLATGEMAHLYYDTLGNQPYYDTSGAATGCSLGHLGGPTPSCFSNEGPFRNVEHDYENGGNYWSGAGYAADSTGAWMFNFEGGSQTVENKTSLLHAWAVHTGDLAVVPVPAAVWLLGSALGLLAWTGRKWAA